MTGRHEGPPLGSAARDTTAPPYHGKRRAQYVVGGGNSSDISPASRAVHVVHYPSADELHMPCGCPYPLIGDHAPCVHGLSEPEPDDPPRCWSCGHPWDAGCECSCCGDNAPEGWGPDAI